MQRTKGSPRNRKTSVLVLNRQLSVGGAERQIMNLLKGFDRDIFNVVSVPFYDGGALYHEVLTLPGVQCRSLKKRGRWDVFGFLFRYFALLNELKPDIVYGFMDSPNLLALFAKFWGAKVAWGIRGSGLELQSYDWSQKLLTKLEIMFSWAADAIICNSSAGAKYVQSLGFPTNKVFVVANGIDTDKFQLNHSYRELIRESWGIDSHTTLVGLVGRLDPMKDHFTFLATVAEIIKRSHNIRFTCIGSGETQYQNELLQYAKILGIKNELIWAPAQQDIERVYPALDVLCLSSIGEGFPNVIGEAMACGVPCVCTDVGDAALILNDKKRIVKIREPKELADAILLIQEDLKSNREKIQMISRQRIVDHFSVKKMVHETSNILIALKGPSTLPKSPDLTETLHDPDEQQPSP